jgi:hypothetical protein
MFPKTGNKFPRRHTAVQPRSPFAQLIADALRSSLDDSHRAVKTVMVWTGANERTVKNWLSGAHGPHGDYLLVLLRKSDAVVDALVGTLPPDRLTELAVRLIRRGGGDRLLPWTTMSYTETAPGPEPVQTRMSESTDSSNGDPSDPDHGPESDPDSADSHSDLNVRQIWFLRQLKSGQAPRIRDLKRQHNVSEKTAKRDIAGLRQRKIIKYVGSHRKGQYVPIR